MSKPLPSPGEDWEQLLDNWPAPERTDEFWESQHAAVWRRIRETTDDASEVRSEDPLLLSPLPRVAGEPLGVTHHQLLSTGSDVTEGTLADLARKTLQAAQAERVSAAQRYTAAEEHAAAVGHAAAVATAPAVRAEQLRSTASDASFAPRGDLVDQRGVGSRADVVGPQAAIAGVAATRRTRGFRSAWVMPLTAMAAGGLLWIGTTSLREESRLVQSSASVNGVSTSGEHAVVTSAAAPSPSVGAQAQQDGPGGVSAAATEEPVKRSGLAQGAEVMQHGEPVTQALADLPRSRSALPEASSAVAHSAVRPSQTAQPSQAAQTSQAVQPIQVVLAEEAPAAPGSATKAKLQDRGGPEDSAMRPAADVPGTLPQEPSVGAVQAALGQVLGSARVCVAGHSDSSRATVTFDSTGVVRAVSVTGPAQGTPAEKCIQTALSAARMAPFAQSSFSARTTVRP